MKRRSVIERDHEHNKEIIVFFIHHPPKCKIYIYVHITKKNILK